MKDNYFHINIGRQIGAGGLELARILGKKYGINVYDKELIYMAAKESGLDKGLFENADENNNLNLHNNFNFSSFASMTASVMGFNSISGGKLFKIQSDVILDLAAKESTIFIGRCADYILRDCPNCLNVFITADKNDRIARARKGGLFGKDTEKLSDEKISEMLDKGDIKRSDYYGSFSFKVWGAAESYDMCLNSSVLGMDRCVKIISDYIDEKLLRK